MRRLCNIALAAAILFVCNGCNYHKVIDDTSLGKYYRSATAASSPFASTVCEYTPAPGQFIGDPAIFPTNLLTQDAACAWAKERLDANKFVSLGAFGGFIVVGFDHSIVNLGGYDFAIYGNAFHGNSEPGIVWVAQDANGNGKADDKWYELRGSDTYSEFTLRDYSVTYYKPTQHGQSVRWKDSEGEEGTIDYLAAYHQQASYYPEWITEDQYTLTGTRLKAFNYDSSGNGSMWINPDYDWGYADNANGNLFRISDAIDAEGKAVELNFIDFIKVQTALNAKSGWVGELSTEVLGFEDRSMIVTAR